MKNAQTENNNPLEIQIGGNHYKDFAIQPVEYITKNNLEFLEGCIIKRISRYDKPTGKGIEDLEKIKHEVDLLIALKKLKKVKEKDMGSTIDFYPVEDWHIKDSSDTPQGEYVRIAFAEIDDHHSKKLTFWMPSKIYDKIKNKEYTVKITSRTVPGDRVHILDEQGTEVLSFLGD